MTTLVATAAANPATDAAATSAGWQNLFGVCAFVGEDFGFNPDWLRIVFAAALIFHPVAVIGSYFVLGAIVLSSRLLFPNRKPAAVAALAPVPLPKPARAEREPLPLAA